MYVRESKFVYTVQGKADESCFVVCLCLEYRLSEDSSVFTESFE